jgi:hypothetical protein
MWNHILHHISSTTERAALPLGSEEPSFRAGFFDEILHFAKYQSHSGGNLPWHRHWDWVIYLYLCQGGRVFDQ